jgi:multisubunit Na+/H+ antiporter MnhB subunit
MVYLSLYVLIIKPWLHWLLLLIGIGLILMLEFLLDTELKVQGGIAFGCVGIVFLFWFFYYSQHFKLPPYNWINLTIAVGLFMLATSMFSIQNLFPSMYWAAHGVWHTAAAIGFDYWIRAKEPAPFGRIIGLKI